VIVISGAALLVIGVGLLLGVSQKPNAAAVLSFFVGIRLGPYLVGALLLSAILYVLIAMIPNADGMSEEKSNDDADSIDANSNEFASSRAGGKVKAMEFFDSYETGSPAEREKSLFSRLPDIIDTAKSASGWAKHLDGIDPKFVTSREALAELPLLRKSDLPRLQAETPPFGGFNVTPPGKAKRLLMSPGPIFEPEGHEKDFAGVARAMFAAGFREGHIVLNCFSYHLTPGAWMFESAAEALGCAVIPGGVGNTEQQVEAIARLRPNGYTGTPDFLKVLLDSAQASGKDASSIKRGLVSGAALPATLRQELSSRGVEVLQCYAIAETGVIAYETPAREGLVVNENIIVEIVRPGTGDPVPDGDVGEVVVTSFNPAYPMIRLATGDLSAVLPGRSPCGRTNTRIKGWMGRADQTTKVKGMFVRPEQIAEIAKRHPELSRVRLVVTREGEQDAMTLHAESAGGEGLADAVAATLQSVTKLKGAVKLVAPGSLPNDGKVIADERPVS
jgi:phenylacetate-CoA ligase